MVNNKKNNQALERSLRPKSFADFFGQERLKRNLKIFIEAAQKRNEPLEHVLFYGPPGLGKTTLSHIIAHEIKANIRITSGPAIERTGDLASILTNLENGDILFIDEVHRLSKPVEETLYPAMEEYCLDIVVGKGPSARTLRLELPQFTIIGATTRVGLLSSPLRSRFGTTFRLGFYSDQDLAKIVKRSAEVLSFPIDTQATKEIARRSRGTPRIANKLLRRTRDFAQVRAKKRITKKIVEEALLMLEVDMLGLDQSDRRLLYAIIEKHDGGPVGIETIAATIAEDIGTIVDVYEPFLMQIGFLKRTSRGRVATKRAYKHLGIIYPRDSSKKKTKRSNKLKQEKLIK